MGDDALTIVVADDHAVVREGLRVLLESEPGFAVVGEAGDLDGLEAQLAERRPRVLLLDLHMGEELSLDRLPRLRAASPDTGVVVLTMQNDPAFARRALAEGAEGYVLKEAPRAQLVLAIRTVAGGGTYLPAGMSARALAAPEEDDPLTERERTVLRLLALGHTNAEIAAQLYVSARTVETHRASVQRKLGASGRPDLVRYAIARGMLEQ